MARLSSAKAEVLAVATAAALAPPGSAAVVATVSEVALADPSMPAAEKRAMEARLSSAKAEAASFAPQRRRSSYSIACDGVAAGGGTGRLVDAGCGKRWWLG